MRNVTPYIAILLEEPSAQMVIDRLYPKILQATEVEVKFLQLGIKPLNLQNRRRELEKRLRIYQDMIQNGLRVGVMILIDKDRDKCEKLKQDLETIARRIGLPTKTNPRGDRFHVVNRIAIEELEAWYLGDPDALKKAYPKLSKEILKRHARNPDAIEEKTKETLHKLLQNAGYYQDKLEQIDIAEKMAQHMQPHQNTSPSFKHFANGMKALANQLLSS